MQTIPRSQNHLAELLGISKGAASIQAGRGMPMHSLEAAQAWRKAHLDPARVKGTRFDQYRKPKPRQQVQPLPAPEPTEPEPAWLEIASAVLELAAVVLRSGQNIKAMVPTLRAALACVSVHERAALPLPLDVIKVLVADVLAMVPPKEGNPLNYDGTPVWCNGKDMPDDEAAEMSVFWYQVAAGEVTVG